jgi:hypothetical protein
MWQSARWSQEAVDKRVKRDNPAQRWAEPQEIGDVSALFPLNQLACQGFHSQE